MYVEFYDAADSSGFEYWEDCEVLPSVNDRVVLHRDIPNNVHDELWLVVNRTVYAHKAYLYCVFLYNLNKPH